MKISNSVKLQFTSRSFNFALLITITQAYTLHLELRCISKVIAARLNSRYRFFYRAKHKKYLGQDQNYKRIRE